MKKPFAYFLCAITVLFLLFIPVIIVDGVNKNIYNMREQEPRFEGFLTLWHIVDFKTGGQSGSSYIQNRISEFEKKHPRMFIEMEALDVQEANEKIKNGEFPDIISFPLGFLSDTSMLCSLPQIEAYFVRDNYTYPYMADFYVLTCDPSLDLPMDYYMSKEALNYIIAGGVKLTASNEQAIKALDHTLLTTDETFVEEVEQKPLSPTIGKGELYVCPHAEYCKMEEDRTPFIISSYTNMVQYIGTKKCDDPLKQQICVDFLSYLLTESAQSALTDTRLLPSTPIPDLYSDDPFMTEVYAGAINMLVP